MIGVFDSGFGGLTVLRELLRRLPQYDYLYLADRARGPYGALSEGVINAYTRHAVSHLFERGCELVVVACNTASARALRNIQQRVLPEFYPDRRVLGVIRPSVEALVGIPVGDVFATGAPEHLNLPSTVAILATRATVDSNSYRLELAKLASRVHLVQQACPLWAPLVEEGELSGPGIEYYLHKYLDPLLDGTLERPSRVLLACTHFPLLYDGIRTILPDDIELITQADTVAERLQDWLRRHPEMDTRLSRGGSTRFMVTTDRELFQTQTANILGRAVTADLVELGTESS